MSVADQRKDSELISAFKKTEVWEGADNLAGK